MSPSTRSISSGPNCLIAFSRDRTNARTLTPRRTNALTRLFPSRPVAPVTNAVFIGYLRFSDDDSFEEHLNEMLGQSFCTDSAVINQRIELRVTHSGNRCMNKDVRRDLPCEAAFSLCIIKEPFERLPHSVRRSHVGRIFDQYIFHRRLGIEEIRKALLKAEFERSAISLLQAVNRRLFGGQVLNEYRNSVHERDEHGR